jgi:hypothetical protein
MRRLQKYKMKQIINKVRWEKNSFVRQHPDISPDNIVEKTSTDKFPANAATVRFQNMTNRIASVYFYGEQKTKSYNGGYTHTYTDKKLKVFLPHKGHNNRNNTYSFNGELPDNFSLEQMSVVLKYVSNIVNS